ncbi:MAG: hypothetical protein LBG27_02430 [Spirochaetaceae bacterium]|nr:hypothetical protein [Spirochaetaceae bacterium]
MNNVTNGFPPVALALLLAVALAAVMVCIVGFAMHGVNFLKYGFKQMVLNVSLEKRFDDLGAKIDGLRSEVDGLRNEVDNMRNEFRTELQTITVNHFGHLKNYLGVLNGILLDKGVIDNESRARLDNELRGM